MDIQDFNLLLSKTNQASQSDIKELENLILEYPYFQGAIFAYLKALYNSPEKYETELKRLSIKVKDRRALFYYIFSEEYDRFFAETGKKDIPEDKTNILLNAFFESRDESDTDNMQLEYNISHASLATTDYITYIQSQDINSDKNENTSQLKHQNIIDTFITKSEEGEINIHIDKDNSSYNDEIAVDEENENKDELSEDIFFTETLAKIYIKQKKYEKAFKIIKHLSLNYPKKNIYFADQLGFLEKLIINSKYKNKK